MSLQEGQGYLSLLKDGAWHMKSRGDSNFLGKEFMKTVEAEIAVECGAQQEYHHENISSYIVNSSFTVDEVFTTVQLRVQEFVEAGESADLPEIMPEFAEFGVPIPDPSFSNH